MITCSPSPKTRITWAQNPWAVGEGGGDPPRASSFSKEESLNHVGIPRPSIRFQVPPNKDCKMTVEGSLEGLGPCS